MNGKKTLGKAIDEIVAALESLDDSARATAVRAACEHLGISAPPLGGSTPAADLSFSPSTDNTGDTPSAPHAQVMDIRTLKDAKQPATATEMACLVAYYLESLAPPNERRKEVSTADMERYFKQGGYRLPKRIPQLLVNAKASGYFDSAGHGKYKLNPVGHNLVVHSLPKTKK